MVADGRAAILAAVAVGIAAGALPAQGGSVQIRSVRTMHANVSTRLIIQPSDPVAYRLRRTAGGGPQILLDLPGAQLPPGGFKPLSIGTGPIERVRVVRTGQGARLLIETRGEATATAFALSKPFRLVVDVAPQRRPRAAAPAPTPTRASASAPAPTSVALAARQPTPRAVVAKPAVRSRRRNGKRARGHARHRAPVPRLKVVIDPGHGGKDPGAKGVGGLREKDIVLAISQRLAAKLRASGAFDVILTRNRDVYLALEERTSRANTEDADLFVSIHANASPNASAAGMETYYLNNTKDRGTLRLAQMENGFAAATGRSVKGTDVAWILSDLVQSYKVDESVELADCIQRAAVARVRQRYRDLHDLGVKQGPFYVLVGAAMPSVLVEVSFLTHPTEGARLGTAAYREEMAEGILRGLREFVENRWGTHTL